MEVHLEPTEKLTCTHFGYIGKIYTAVIIIAPMQATPFQTRFSQLIEYKATSKWIELVGVSLSEVGLVVYWDGWCGVGIDMGLFDQNNNLICCN